MNEIFKLLYKLSNDTLFWVLLIAMLADIITGFTLSAKYHRISSRVMGLGLQNKFNGVISAIVLYLIFEIMGMDPVADLSFGFITLKEFISWFENLSGLGFSVPSWITDYLYNSIDLNNDKAEKFINKKDSTKK